MRACTLFITYYTNMVAPLKISVQGMEDAVNSEFQNAQERSKKVLQVIWQNARAKQTLVFCTSKMNASNLARYLVAQGVLVTPNTKLGAKQYLEQYYDGVSSTLYIHACFFKNKLATAYDIVLPSIAWYWLPS